MNFGHQSDWYQNQPRLVLLLEYFVRHTMRRSLTDCQIILKISSRFMTMILNRHVLAFAFLLCVSLQSFNLQFLT